MPNTPVVISLAKLLLLMYPTIELNNFKTAEN